MASYTITEVKEGYVYCVVHKDDGSTFGQMVYGDASKTEAGIAASIEGALKRLDAQEKPREATLIKGAVKSLEPVEKVVEEAVK